VYLEEATFVDFGDLAVGAQLPEPAEFSVPLCDYQDVRQVCLDIVQDDFGHSAALESIKFDSVHLYATTGDFSDLTYLSVACQPRPVDDVEQNEILLGEAESETGFNNLIALSAGEDVDLLQLIDAEEANPADGCPTLNVVLDGFVPDSIPQFSVNVDLKLTVRLFANI